MKIASIVFLQLL